jgi:hypothetical protein
MSGVCDLENNANFAQKSENEVSRKSYCYVPEEQGPLHIDDTCEWVGDLQTRAEHVRFCFFRRLVGCPLASVSCHVGCANRKYTRGELRMHLVEFSTNSALKIGEISKELEVYKKDYRDHPAPTFSMFKDRQTQCGCHESLEGAFCGQTQLGPLIKNGSGIFKAHGGCTSYVGEYKNNLRHGCGIYHHSMFHYVGMFYQDLMQGECYYFCNPSKKRCGRGMFANNVMHGVGKIWSNTTATSKFMYAGQFVNDKRHGQGTQINAAGTRMFTGPFVDDAIRGEGVCTLLKENRHTISGTFHGEHCFGHGVLKDQFGVVLYVGNFVRSVKEGEGIMTYANGDVYTGTFSKGLRHGRGVLVFADKSEYHGGFLKDKFHGEGEMRGVDGVILRMRS